MPVRNVRKSSKEIIYEDLLDQIEHCDLLPGAPINEATMLNKYGVSKTPFREALNLLYQDHLVDIFPQSGTFVSKIDLKRIDDLVFMRFAVENEVSKTLIERKDPLNNIGIDKILTLEEMAMNEKDWREAVSLDYEFHKALFKAADREEAWFIIEKNVLPYYTRLRFFTGSIDDGHSDYPRTHEEHVAMARYIREGNEKKFLEVVNGTHNKWFRSEELKKDILAHPDYFVSIDFK